MNIALVSVEYPYQEIEYGGIGTYIYELGGALSRKGHYVEIFCGSLVNKGFFINDFNCRVNKIFIPSHNVSDFKNLVLNPFKDRHSIISFDLIEGAEFNADTLIIKNKLPQIPLIIKLHTPKFLLSKHENSLIYNSSNFFLRLFKKIYLVFLEGYGYRNYSKSKDTEYLTTQVADTIYSPSIKLKRKLEKLWGLREVYHIPNLFSAKPEYLEICPRIDKEPFNVLSIGTISKLKGIEIYLKVIPKVVSKNKNIKFMFIGKDCWGPGFRSDVKSIFDQHLKEYTRSFEFHNKIPLGEIPFYINKSNICIFTSLWENAPYACIEAMSAGKYIIASSATGMAELVTEDVGATVDPLNANNIAKEILYAYNNYEEVVKKGLNARLKVTKYYNSDELIDRILALYTKTINCHK